MSAEAKLGLACTALSVVTLALTTWLGSLDAKNEMVLYQIQIEAYVRDEQELCKHAWQVAIERFGPGVAETVTMTRGKYQAEKCLAVMYQVGRHDAVVSAGINVREASK